jgi:transcriptional regulator with XRE-family HTH domain
LMHGSLATRLRVLRAERGLTVRQVAELSGVAKETVSQIERGERHPYDRTLEKLAHAYGVPIEELLEEPALAGKADAPTTGRGEEPRGRKIRRTVTDTAGVTDSVEIKITREKLASAVALVMGVPEEEAADIADELLVAVAS